MKINVRDKIKDYEGKNVPDNGSGGQPLTLLAVFYNALNSMMPGETMLAEDKALCYNLTNKLYANKEVNITINEASLLKERVGKMYNPLVYGRVCDVLEGNFVQVDNKGASTPVHENQDGNGQDKSETNRSADA